MPFDVNVRSLQLDPQADLRVAPSTPAIQALMDATRSGAIDFQTINDHFSKGVKEGVDLTEGRERVQASKIKQNIAPKIAALEEQLTDLKAQLQPAISEKAKIDAGTAVEASKFARDTQPAIQAVGTAQANAGVSEAKDLAQITKRNETQPGVLDAYKSYKAKGLQIPRMPYTGEIDADEMLANLAKLDRQSLATAGTPLVDSKVLHAEFIKNGGVLINADGSVKPDAQISSENAALVQKQLTALTPAQKAEELSGIETAEGTLRKISSVSDILFKKDAAGNVVKNADGTPQLTPGNKVGPGIGSGPGSVALQALASLGIAKGQQRDQRKIQALSADLTLSKAAAMKGALSDKDREFLSKSVPGIDADEQYWYDYLTEVVPVMQASIDRRKSALVAPGTSPAAAAPTAKKTLQLPGKPAGVNEQNFVPTDSAEFEQYAKVAVPATTLAALAQLKPGQPFFDHTGKLRINP